jgi:hypothetical protein
MIDEDAYEQAVNAQWLKLAHAESNDELKEVLNTWPEPKDYEIKEEPKDEENDKRSKC